MYPLKNYPCTLLPMGNVVEGNNQIKCDDNQWFLCNWKNYFIQKNCYLFVPEMWIWFGYYMISIALIFFIFLASKL